MDDESYERGVRDEVKVQKRGEAGRVIRLLFAAIVVAAIVVMGLDNRQKVRFGYPSGHAMAPMWVVVVAAAIAGVVIGWLIKHRPHHVR